MKRIVLVAIVALAALGGTRIAQAVTFNVSPGSPWTGFMNVFDLSNAYQFGSGWGVADLTAVFSGPVLTLGPNTIADASPYWYTPSGGPGATGNKIMDANFYVEAPTGSLAGQSVTFTGKVLSNTLVSPYTSVAFIKDFAPDYSTNISTTVALTPGVFSITLNALNNPLRHVQFGFETIGPDVWITDVGPKGNVQIVAVPEPATATLGILSLAALIGSVRRRK